MVTTYQSQVIAAAVQSCDHHLLIYNPYCSRETKIALLARLSVSPSAVTVQNKMFRILGFDCPHGSTSLVGLELDVC